MDYRDPRQDAKPVADHLCFFNERVDLEVNGEHMDRPRTQGSGTTTEPTRRGSRA